MASPPMMKPQPVKPAAPARPTAGADGSGKTPNGASPNGASGVQAEKRPPLSKRIPDMSDADLAALQKNAVRISGDSAHPKQAAAHRALERIDAEIGKRASGGRAGHE